MIIPSQDWLKALNVEFRTQNISVRQRPFLAIDRYCKDFNVPTLALDSQPAEAISEWFFANTEEEAHHVGNLFRGVFYYDTCFWPVDIFIAFGHPAHDTFSSLKTMSASMKGEMMSGSSDVRNSYLLSWSNCVDYGYGFDDMQKELTANSYAHSLLENADRELRASISQLLECPPNAKAAMSCRMAVEIFLKAFLVLRAGLSERAIIAHNHNLNKLLESVRAIEPNSELLNVEASLSIFPEIKDRYTGNELSAVTLWESYCIALHIGAVVARSFTNRNIRSSVESSI
jgi:HEPN domain-containing protein